MNFIILQFWGSEIQNESHWAKIWVFPGPHLFQEALFPCLFELLEAAHTPWLMAPSKTANLHLLHCSSVVMSPSNHSWERVSNFKDLCNILGPPG